MVRIGLWRACCRQGGREPLPRCRFMRHSGLDPRSPPVRFGAMSLLFLQLGHGAQRPDWLAVVTSTAGVPCPHGVRGVFGFSRSSGCDRGKSRRANILRCHSPSNFLGRVGDGSHRRYRKNFWYGCLKISRVSSMAHLRNDQLSSAFRFSGAGTMFRQTCIKPEMSSSRAAICDKSTILPLTKGPRSVIRTTTVRPFS